jgi:hypothetical protein
MLFLEDAENTVRIPGAWANLRFIGAPNIQRRRLLELKTLDICCHLGVDLEARVGR